MLLLSSGGAGYAGAEDRLSQPGAGGGQARGLVLKSGAWTGDFDKMLENRRIRVLVPPGRTLYFNDRGRERGITGETVRDFERYLNSKYKGRLKGLPLTVFIVPTPRDALISGVAGGLGDIAAGDITITDERLKTVDFVPLGEAPGVNEILVTGPKSPAIGAIGDLAGRTVHVRKSTSYFDSLSALNLQFKKEGKPEINIIPVPDALEDEDLMEMLGAGLFQYIVVDDWIAKIWAQVVTGVKVREDIILRKGGRTGWAIRKGSPGLEAEILDFQRNFLDRQGVPRFRLAEYRKKIRKLSDPTGGDEWRRFNETLVLFEKYGKKYRFDPIMLAAQGYQESRLDQGMTSHLGATGVMQVMPATGASLGVGDIRELEPNIHAGVKYLDQLMSLYFPGAEFSDQERTLFAFAAYNAGPGNVIKMRKLAERRGLDRNKWFRNVEIVAAEKFGMETTMYVRSIYKYYVAYRLMLDQLEQKRNARESFPVIPY
jgi:membrane-bound lytic murein transglycosylase MltF